MAEIVNLRENEYQVIVSELSKMHTEQMQNIKEIVSELQKLVTSNDSFTANHTSKKILDILDVLSDDILALLQQSFQDSEAGVANMILSMTTTDSACG